MKIAVVDYRMDEKCRKSLEDEGFIVIDSFKNTNVMPSLSGHVDISMFSLCDGAVVARESYPYYSDMLKGYGINIYSSHKCLGYAYPEDTVLNFCDTGKYIIGKMENMDPVLKDIICGKSSTEKRIFVEVKQGYANCSIVAVDRNSVITSDRGIWKVLVQQGLDVLLIESGSIELFDMNYGFIGGACGVYGDNVYFFGDIMSHPDGHRIKKFIEERGKKAVSLSDSKLRDYGSMFVFEVQS